MVNGVIVVMKERGMTSFGVVSRMRRIFDQKKIGHTGTLDPDVEGVLVVCMGRATKLVDDLSRGTKTYECTMLLGRTTDTQDAGGKTLSEREVAVSGEEVRDAVFSFSGKQMQVPPMYSAVKIGGKKLVDLARRGIEVERKPREVEFSGIEIMKMDLPRVRFRVTCSHGSYIRTLCNDIGEKLGCGAVMEELLRTRVEEFTIKDAHTLSEIAERKAREDADGIRQYSFVIPIEHFYRDLPCVTVLDEVLGTAVNGAAVDLAKTRGAEKIRNHERVRLRTEDGAFIGIYARSGGVLRVEKYFYENDQSHS